ncbi:MAG TPA: tetratricopeptide repeat protein [Pyrinomonadaceae bacterium]|nr:tetratricopeptide repeat protein [Pyrinomonadaceae bacterium]
MIKRTLLVLFLTVTLVFGVSGLQAAHTIVLSDEEVAALSQADGSLTSLGAKQGNGFVRALKAPFKAIGRLFGRGKKDDNKLHRLTEKDVESFESTKFTRVTDATQTPTQNTSNGEIGAGAAERVELGRTLLNNNKLNEAISELSLAASIDPNLAEAHNLLGVAYHRKGLRELARKSFEKAVKLNKNNAQILNNLGYLLYDNSEYKAAFKHLKKAAQLAPTDARILNNLALTQSQLGKFDDAYKNFARAGGEIDGRLNIANRLEIAGHPEKAREHYEAARAQAEANQRANNGSQTITVVMEIENGRVKYASVANRRPGLAAYEATALRIARGRRYAAGKTGQESIVIRVQPMPAS